jgi:hypothetical protein
MLPFLLLPSCVGAIIDDLPERRRQRLDVLHLIGTDSSGGTRGVEFHGVLGHFGGPALLAETNTTGLTDVGLGGTLVARLVAVIIVRTALSENFVYHVVAGPWHVVRGVLQAAIHGLCHANQYESFSCLYLMVKNKEISIKRYFK